MVKAQRATTQCLTTQLKFHLITLVSETNSLLIIYLGNFTRCTGLFFKYIGLEAKRSYILFGIDTDWVL